MNVLLLAFDSEELSIRLAAALADQVSVTLMLPEASSKPYLKWMDTRVRFEPFFLPRLRQPLRQAIAMMRILSRIRNLNPDLIHMQKWHLWFFLMLPLLRNYPIVLAVHDPVPHTGDKNASKTPRRVIRFGYRRAARIIVHNPAMRDLLHSVVGYPTERVDVVPLLERGDADLACEVSEEGNQVLFFGRIWEYKGLKYLIEASVLIAERIPEIRFVIAGRGEPIDKYLVLINDRARFEIHNEYLDEESAAVLFRRSSLVVLPYTEATQSGVIPVAYSFKRPVVASSVGGIPFQVDDGVTGLLVPPRDPKALADAVVALMRDPTRRIKMGAAAAHKAATEWSAEAVAKQTLSVYQRVLSRSS